MVVKQYILRMKSKGSSPRRKPLFKIAWSGVGSFLGIYLIGSLAAYWQGMGKDFLFLIGSFGASAVLIYGVPLADFSQPRNLIGGHVLSAIIGVAIGRFLAEEVVLASALAVSLSIVVMHFTRTLHPQGGLRL